MAQTRKSQFVIEPEEAESMRKQLNLPSLPALLPALLPAAGNLSRPAISHFPVGASALGESGRIYLGANVEFPKLPLHHSIHAEQFLIQNSILHSEPSLPFIAISHFPCGHCRQFLQEIRSASRTKILVAGGDDSDFRPLDYFLPNPFRPSDLLDEDVPLLLEPRFNCLIAVEDGELRGGLEGRVREEAVRAANESHAPYSGSASGFAVADEEGAVYAGSYAESCAYNPSLGPVQAAVVAYLVGGGGGGEDGELGGRMVAGVLAEREGAAVRQEETTRVLFSAMAPKATFNVCRLRRSDEAA